MARRGQALRAWLLSACPSRTKAILAVASPRRVYDASFWDGFEKSLTSQKNQCSIAFQPVFFEPPSDVLQVSAVPPSCV
jgi:hypothetical protein